MVAAETGYVRLDFKRDWPAAIVALRKLMRDHRDTAEVFNVIRALSGRSMARCYTRLLRTVEGGRIGYEHAEFAERLAEAGWLQQFAPGSVGAAYRSFIAENQITSEGLVQVSRKKSSQHISNFYNPHPYNWMGRRIRDVHDIWHVLCGYGSEPLGEGCLVAFSYAQTDDLGWAVIALGGTLSKRRNVNAPVRLAVWEGYRRGRRAAWLLDQDYERLMAEPLEAARQRLGLGTPVIYNSIPAAARSTPTRSKAISAPPAEIANA